MYNYREFVRKYDLEYTRGSYKPNLYKMPTNLLKPNIQNEKIINELYGAVMDDLADGKIHAIKRTPSGGLSTKKFWLPACNVYLIPSKNKEEFKGIEIVVITAICMFKLSFTGKPQGLSGGRCFKRFCSVFKKFGINLEDHKISKEKGLEYKEKIPKLPICTTENTKLDFVYTQAHHIDRHSSFAGGIAHKYPEFKKPLEYMYKKRHDNPIYKQVLTNSIGYMQSEYCHYNYAHLSYAAISDNNEQIMALANRVNDSMDAHREVVLFNTDGFWYIGPEYHGYGEGDELGQWHNDHVNCTLRIKSEGAYEYIEDGKYTPVLRGSCVLDRIKPRDSWEWGDIYNRDAMKSLKFGFDVIRGVYHETESN